MGKILSFIIILLALLGVVLLVPGLGIFDEKAPKIEFNSYNNTIYWNPKEPLMVKINDESGVSEVEASLEAANLAPQTLISSALNGEKELALELKFPASLKYKNGDEYTLNIKARDTSKANLFSGNTALTQIKVLIDTRAPDVLIINQSYKIIQGGAAVAVFRVSDSSGAIKELFVETSFGKKFKALPFYKDGYYAALIAWPSKEKSFSASVVASDLAGNKAKSPIKLYLQGKKYKESKIAINDNFINGKISELVNMYAQNPAQMDAISKFKFVNEDLRASNEEKIKEITANPREAKLGDLGEFFIKPFYPLKNGAAVASFGDHRFFSYNGEHLSESYHMGLDLASTAAANITATNAGEVVFADENGIYGKNLILYHGFGLYTLYGHCTSFGAEHGQKASEGSVIATTGVSGLALGDHLHFGIVIQGIEVRPEEWMDKKWMKENVYDILNGAKQAIDGLKS